MEDEYIEPELRDGTKVIETNEFCCTCSNELKIATDKTRPDMGVCLRCGFPYRIDPVEMVLDDNMDAVIATNRDITPRHLSCISDYRYDTGRPAPLWSFTPFKSIEFERFSEWAIENNYSDLSWLKKQDL